jgi:hypothetical protein
MIIELPATQDTSSAQQPPDRSTTTVAAPFQRRSRSSGCYTRATAQPTGCTASADAQHHSPPAILSNIAVENSSSNELLTGRG